MGDMDAALAGGRYIHAVIADPEHRDNLQRREARHEFAPDLGFAIGGNAAHLRRDGSERFIGERIENEVVTGEVLLQQVQQVLRQAGDDEDDRAVGGCHGQYEEEGSEEA
jgi:hypothetical protein